MMAEMPPGGWRYKDKDTAIWINAPTYLDLRDMVRRHRRANNLPVPSILDEQIDAQLCELIPPQWCARNAQAYTPRTLTLSDVVQGTSTLLAWMSEGKPMVSAAEAERRAFICSRCHFNQDISGCANCGRKSLMAVVEKIVGANSTQYDNRLYSCGVCGCNLRAKVWFPFDLLLSHIPQSQLGEYPSFCWLKEINEPRTDTPSPNP